MTFPDRVLTAEQREQRARAILDVIGGRIDGIGWEAIQRPYQRGLTKAWAAMQTELTLIRLRPR